MEKGWDDSGLSDQEFLLLQKHFDSYKPRVVFLVFCVGLTRRDLNMEAVQRERQIPYVDLSTPLRYPQFGNHWTPEGHTFVCEQIEGFFAGGPEQPKSASVER